MTVTHEAVVPYNKPDSNFITTGYWQIQVEAVVPSQYYFNRCMRQYLMKHYSHLLSHTLTTPLLHLTTLHNLHITSPPSHPHLRGSVVGRAGAGLATPNHLLLQLQGQDLPSSGLADLIHAHKYTHTHVNKYIRTYAYM